MPRTTTDEFSETLPTTSPSNDGGVRLGSIGVSGPAELVSAASSVATELARVISDRGLFKRIKGRDHVLVEGWTTAAAMVGVMPREVGVTEHENGDFEAIVELIRAADGTVIGRGSALCGIDEPVWASRSRQARRSMAITRATGKACRLAFSWVVTLAGYAPTPAEEMDDGPEQTKAVGNADPNAKTEVADLHERWSRLNPDHADDREAFLSWARKLIGTSDSLTDLRHWRASRRRNVDATLSGLETQAAADAQDADSDAAETDGNPTLGW